MEIEVRLYATLRKYAPTSPAGVLARTVPPGTTIGELIQALGIPGEEVKMMMVNGMHSEAGRVLADGDRVGLFPPVGGG